MNLVGLNDEAFKKYCKKIGINSEKYYKKDTITGILLNSTHYKPDNSNEVKLLTLLNPKAGNKMLGLEVLFFCIETNYYWHSSCFYHLFLYV